MAKVEIEVDDATGQPKELPEQLKKHVDTLVDAGFKSRHTKLREEITKELSEKLPKQQPVSNDVSEAERARVKALEEEVERHRIADAERKKDYKKAEEIREEAEKKREAERQAAEAKRDQEIKRRDDRLREMARDGIRMAAKKFGARDESLDELAELLGAKLDLNPDLQPFIKGTDGQPARGEDGEPVTIEGFVKAYINKNQHHLAPVGGTGGGARGGMTLTNLSSEGLDAQRKVEAIQKRVRAGDRSDSTLNELFEAERALKKAASGSR